MVRFGAGERPGLSVRACGRPGQRKSPGHLGMVYSTGESPPASGLAPSER